MKIAPRKFVPRFCQEKMHNFMQYHNRCNVWATPGTGKTGACLLLLMILKLLGSLFFPVLVIAPKKVAENVWHREREKWEDFLGLKIVVLAGREDAYDRIQQLRRPADIYVINYDIVAGVEKRVKGKTVKVWGLIDYLKEKNIEWPFKTVIADESTKLRNFRLRNGGKRAMALARISKHVGRWINLTGTPRPKDLLDLWGPQWFVDRGERLGRTFGDYKKKFFIEDTYSREVEAREGAMEQIADLIKDVTITIKAEDYFDLPPIITNYIRIPLNPAAKAKYDAMENEMYLELGTSQEELSTDGFVEAPNAAVATMKCLQIASGAIYTDEKGAYKVLDSGKLEMLESLADEADGPLLVAYHWKFDRERILKHFKGAREIKDEQSIDDWNAGKIDIGLVHPGSVGHGIDLAVGGNILVFYSQWWDLELFLQVIERIGPTRQAQHELNRPVFLHFLIAEGTLDEACVARRERRRQEQDSLMNKMTR